MFLELLNHRFIIHEIREAHQHLALEGGDVCQLHAILNHDFVKHGTFQVPFLREPVAHGSCDGAGSPSSLEQMMERFLLCIFEIKNHRNAHDHQGNQEGAPECGYHYHCAPKHCRWVDIAVANSSESYDHEPDAGEEVTDLHNTSSVSVRKFENPYQIGTYQYRHKNRAEDRLSWGFL